MPKLTVAEFLEDKNLGLSFSEIAKKHSCSIALVQRKASIASDIGFSYSRKGENNLSSTIGLTRDVVKALLGVGWNFHQIAERFGVKGSRVRALASRSGIHASWGDVKVRLGIVGERLFALARPEATNYNITTSNAEFDFFDTFYGNVDVKTSRVRRRVQGKQVKSTQRVFAFEFRKRKDRSIRGAKNQDNFICYCIDDETSVHHCFVIPGAVAFEVVGIAIYVDSDGVIKDRCKWASFRDAALSSLIDLEAVHYSREDTV